MADRYRWGAAVGRRLQLAVGSGAGGGMEPGGMRSGRGAVCGLWTRPGAAEPRTRRRSLPAPPAAGRGGRGRGRAGCSPRGQRCLFPLSSLRSRPRASAGRREVGGCQSGARQGWSGDGRGRQRLRGSVSGAVAAARGSPSPPAPVAAAQRPLTLFRRLVSNLPRGAAAASGLPAGSWESVPPPAAGWGWPCCPPGPGCEAGKGIGCRPQMCPHLL